MKNYQRIMSITNPRKSAEEPRKEESDISSRRLLNGESFIQELVTSQDSMKSIHLRKPRKKWGFLKRVLMITYFRSDSGIASTSILTSIIMKRWVFWETSWDSRRNQQNLIKSNGREKWKSKKENDSNICLQFPYLVLRLIDF